MKDDKTRLSMRIDIFLYIAAILTMLHLCVFAFPTAGLAQPRASFSADPTQGPKPLTVYFTDHSTPS